jgi:hypothetical protein
MGTSPTNLESHINSTWKKDDELLYVLYTSEIGASRIRTVCSLLLKGAASSMPCCDLRRRRDDEQLETMNKET